MAAPRILYPPMCVLWMVRSAAAGLVQAASIVIRPEDLRQTGRTESTGERVSASWAVGRGSDMNKESLLRGKTAEDCPGTPVTAPCPDYYASPVIIIINLETRGAVRLVSPWKPTDGAEERVVRCGAVLLGKCENRTKMNDIQINILHRIDETFTWLVLCVCGSDCAPYSPCTCTSCTSSKSMVILHWWRLFNESHYLLSYFYLMVFCPAMHLMCNHSLPALSTSFHFKPLNSMPMQGLYPISHKKRLLLCSKSMCLLMQLETLCSFVLTWDQIHPKDSGVLMLE